VSADTYFTEQWPVVAADLARWLARRGVPGQEVADVVQETAVRLLRRWEELDHDHPLDALARVVALNLWRDQVKAASAREVCVAALPEPSVEHVEREVVARAEMADVLAGFAGLPEAQRELIRTAVAEALTGAEPARRGAAFRMALMRARRALAARLTGIAALLWPRRRGAGPDVAAATTVAVVVALVIAGPFAPFAPYREPPAAAPPLARPVERVAPAGARRASHAAPVAPPAYRAAPPRPAVTPPAPSPSPSPLLPVDPPVDPPAPRVGIPFLVLPSQVQEPVDQLSCQEEAVRKVICE
jgi:DNA-directed RNA polymerase specialized sigma24 family protein